MHLEIGQRTTTCESYVGRMLPGADILEVETADGVKLPIPLSHPCTCLPTQTVHSVKHPQTKLKTNNCKWKSSYLSHLAPAYPQKQCQAPTNEREHTKTSPTVIASQVTYPTPVPVPMYKHPQTSNQRLSIADQDLNMTETKDTLNQPRSRYITTVKQAIDFCLLLSNGLW